jgi:hypothetical protein
MLRLSPSSFELLALLGLSLLHLNRGLCAIGVVLGGVLRIIEATVQHEQTAKAQAQVKFFHHLSPNHVAAEWA